MKPFFLSVIACIIIGLLAGGSCAKSVQHFEKTFAITLYQRISRIGEYAVMPLQEEFHTSYLDSGETKKLRLTRKQSKTSAIILENRFSAVLARGNRQISKQVINFQDTASKGVDVTELLNSVKAGDRLILTSEDGEIIYKITYFI